MPAKEIFRKHYSAEELCDLDRDVSEVFDPVYNPAMKDIPQDEYGFQAGSFEVSIIWHPAPKDT